MFKREDNNTIGAINPNPLSKRNMIGDDFLDKMINEDNAYL